ncbi:MAG: class Ib ribonucleoside-diphosphate reductase assembly flavoprotein NrdI [Bacillaceae bacterium]
MLIIYDTMTGNVERFVNKLKYNNVNKLSNNLVINEPFCLITYTIGFGEVPESTKAFLDINSNYLKGVASSGNKVWGNNFARAGDIISKHYNVPLLLKFELGGNELDVEKFKQEVMRIDTRKNS